MAKDAAPEDICPAQSLEPQSFYFLLIFRVYKGEFQTQDSDKVKSAQFVDFHVQNIRYRPKMKFDFLSVHFNLLTVTGPPVGPFAIACLKQIYPILKLMQYWQTIYRWKALCVYFSYLTTVLEEMLCSDNHLLICDKRR